MFLVELLRFISGYIQFTGTGGFSERFINLCSVHNIPLWDVSYFDNSFTACTSIDGYLNIAVCARNSGVKIRRNRSVGLPFIFKKLSPRFGLLIGVVFFFVCISVLSNRVWVIDISGNVSIPEDIVLSAAKESGLSIGQKTDELNVVQLSLDICEAVNGISWAAVRVNGCCVYFDINESEESPTLENKEGFYNVVATKDAQLVVLEPYRGTPQAKIFNSVAKGDILISGITSNRDESVSFSHASGYAVGRTETEISSIIHNEISSVHHTLIKKICQLHFFGINLSFGKKPTQYHQKITQSKMACYNNKTLPIGISYTSFYSVTTKAKKISSKQAKMISLNDFMNKSAEFSQGKQIIKSNVEFSQSPNFTETRGSFICYENIGIEVVSKTDTIIQ